MFHLISPSSSSARDLRCLRNTIHANLFVTYIMSALFWILTLSFQISVHPGMASCVVLVTLLHYFSLTNFSWMLVEGELNLFRPRKCFYSRREINNKPFPTSQASTCTCWWCRPFLVTRSDSTSTPQLDGVSVRHKQLLILCFQSLARILEASSDLHVLSPSHSPSPSLLLVYLLFLSLILFG